MKTIEMIIISIIVNWITTSEILMQFDYKCENYLEYIQVGDTKWFFPISNRDKDVLNTVYFKGDPTQKIIVSIFNSGEPGFFLGGIMTIGTTKYSTTSIYWNSNDPKVQRVSTTKIIKGENVQIFEMETGFIQSYTFTFIIPNEFKSQSS